MPHCSSVGVTDGSEISAAMYTVVVCVCVCLITNRGNSCAEYGPTCVCVCVTDVVSLTVPNNRQGPPLPFVFIVVCVRFTTTSPLLSFIVFIVFIALGKLV